MARIFMIRAIIMNVWAYPAVEGHTPSAVATLADVQPADISRIRKADLDRFTIDHLVRILNRLDRRVEVRLEFRSALYPPEQHIHP